MMDPAFEYWKPAFIVLSSALGAYVAVFGLPYAYNKTVSKIRRHDKKENSIKKYPIN